MSMESSRAAVVVDLAVDEKAVQLCVYGNDIS
jgi:hypothetical protein